MKRARSTVTFVIGLLLMGSAVCAWGVTAQRVSDEELARIRFEQKLNQSVSLDLRFKDERGRSISLKDAIAGKPTIVVLGYYSCPMLCTLVLNGLVESLQEIKSSPGDSFSVVCVSIDPAEKPILAAHKKATYLKRYGRPASANGWHFLTGDEPNIRPLASQVGFNYAYDAASKQFAHPSGLVIVTPQGKISRYFFGVSFPPNEVSVALKNAAAEKSGSAIQEFLFLCFHYNPIKSKYGGVIMATVRITGVCTVLALAGGIVLMHRQGRGRA